MEGLKSLSIFSDHNGIEFGINNKTSRKYSAIWKLSSTILNNSWVNNRFKREIRKHFELTDNKNTTYRNMRNTSKVVQRGTSELQMLILNNKKEGLKSLIWLPP